MEENSRPIIYSTPVTTKRLASLYRINLDHIRRMLCRAELHKFTIPGMQPRKYCWCKEMELTLDKLLNPKGFYRCTDSKVHSRYSLERESSYSI